MIYGDVRRQLRGCEQYPESGKIKAVRAAQRMKLDAASHLLRYPISFELFLLVYLVCALLLQMINIYKTVRVVRVEVVCII